MTPTTLTCPTCSAALKTSTPPPPGRSVKCPKCGKTFRAPGEAAAAQEAKPAEPPKALAPEKPAARAPSPPESAAEPPVKGILEKEAPRPRKSSGAVKKARPAAEPTFADEDEPSGARAPRERLTEFIFEEGPPAGGAGESSRANYGLPGDSKFAWRVAAGVGIVTVLLAVLVVIRGSGKKAPPESPPAPQAKKEPEKKEPEKKPSAEKPPPEKPPATGPRELIVGKWDSLDAKEKGSVEFGKDGTVEVIDGQAGPLKGTYTFLDDKNIEIVLDMGGTKVTEKLKVEVGPDQLVTTNQGNAVKKFKRSGAK